MLKRLIQFWSEERSLSSLLWILLIYVFLINPLIDVGVRVRLLRDVLFSLIFFSGALVIRPHKLFQAVIIVYILLSLTVRWVQTMLDMSWLRLWDALLSLGFFCGMVIVVLVQVNRPGRITGHRVRGAVAAYLLLAVLFAYGYSLIEALVPGSFQLPQWWPETMRARGEGFFYFSVVTLTTVGFGDITPALPFARTVVMAEALIGQLFPAILIARLVSLEIEARRSR